jgi:hypothetical protein
MKMLMIIVDEAKKEELEVFLNRAGVMGYTEVSHAAGMGTTGPRLGSGAFPATSAIVFTILSEEALATLQREMSEFCETCGTTVRMIAWTAEQVW